MGALNLRPGHVYFLTMEDDHHGDRDFSYYKIGITEGRISERIDQLQTGNPFRISERHSFWSEAAQLIEGHLHRRWSTNGVRLEWFRFRPMELESVISEAEHLNAQISPIAGRVREYDKTPSNGLMLDPTEHVRELSGQASELMSDIVQRRGQLKILECQLRVLSSDSAGIEGITRVRIIHPDLSFKQALLKERFPDIYEEFLTREKLSCSFNFEAMPRITAFPALQSHMREARDRVPDINPGAFRDCMLEREAAVEELHGRYLELRSKLSADEGGLLTIELELRDLCGVNEGITGVCSYSRALSTHLDARGVHRAHPEIYSACLDQTPPHLRFSVVESRDYE